MIDDAQKPHLPTLAIAAIIAVILIFLYHLGAGHRRR